MSFTKSLVLMAALGVFPAVSFGETFDVSERQQALLAEIPTDSSDEANKIFTELGQDIPALVPKLVSRLTTEKSDADTTARFALGGLVWTVGHSGTDQQKAALARSMADMISEVEGNEPRDFLIEQLQFLGVADVADVLYPLMTDENLGPRAIRTLSALRPEGLAEQVRTNLNDSNTSEVQTGLLLTLAELAPRDAAAQVAPYAEADNIYVKTAALDALAAIGDPASRSALKAAAEQNETFQDKLAPARYLAYAKNVAERGNEALGVEIAREIISAEHTTASQHLVGLGLSTLTDIQGEAALDDLFAWVNHDDEQTRALALDNINRFDSEAVTGRMVEAMQTAPHQEVTVAILLALGDRGAPEALPEVIELFSNEDEEVAVTAVATAGDIARGDAVDALIERLQQDSRKSVADAIVAQLRRVPSEDLLDKVAAAIPEANIDGRVALIGLLGDRNASAQKEAVFTAAASDESKVRAAAYNALGRVAEDSDLPRLRDMILAADSNAERNSARQAYTAVAKADGDLAGSSRLLVEALDEADPRGKAVLMETLAAIGDAGSIAVVKKIADEADGDVKDAAVRALSDWQHYDVLESLINIASKYEEERHKVLAVRGIVRTAGGVKDQAEKVRLLSRAASLASRGEEKKMVAAQLGDVKTTASMLALVPLLKNDDTGPDAAASLVKIAVPDEKAQGKGGLRGAETLAALELALNHIDEKEKRRPVEKHIYELIREVESLEQEVDEEGFISLFNGRDLTGWVGATDAYRAHNGVIELPSGNSGNLFTTKQYGDFVLRLEFKIEKAGNNGVGIRAPLFENAAYAGMEIQILDQNDPKYKDLKDWQRHGSVYGVAAAKPVQLKIGEWNEQEIVATGRNIKVTVNGEVINEVNLDEALKDGFASGKEQPGVYRNRGHIGFMGHNDPIQVRNIRIKNVVNESVPEGFSVLFNGENLDGWKGLVENPIKRRAMTEAELAEKQAKADQEMHDHWSVENGILFFDGLGSHMCTTKDYGNFEMYVDWAIPPGGDNGLYLRGSPQVQIWDPYYWPEGSGGLYNNQKTTSKPLTMADNPIGQWNTFYIKMVDDKVTVDLNGTRVVENQVLENFWDRKQPIFPVEQIELQSHGSPAWWRNIYIRELP